MSGTFAISNNVLSFRRKYETLRIEGWGENALRIRATENRSFTSHDWALTEEVSHSANAYVETRPTPYGYDETIAVVENGNIRAEMTEAGRLRFLNREGKVLLQEFYLSMDHGCAFGGQPDWINAHRMGRKYRTAGGSHSIISFRF